MRIIFFLVCLLIISPVWAQGLSLRGELTQGSMVVGHAEPGAMVFFNDKKLNVTPDGDYVFGISRTASGMGVVEIVDYKGKRYREVFEIKPRQFDIQKIDGLPPEKVTPDAAALERIKADNQQIGRVRHMDSPFDYFTQQFIWPVKGEISGIFGSQRILNGKPKNPHNGVDIAADEGTEIQAPTSGKVVLIHEDMYYTGKTMMLDHGHGVNSVYAHLSEISVKPGDNVQQGDVIGKVGKSGRATGPHLHWGVSVFKVSVDPMLLTGPMPDTTLPLRPCCAERKTN